VERNRKISPVLINAEPYSIEEPVSATIFEKLSGC